ncbi:MAG: signal transduction histidine kinase, partial [Armatimonadetes bacterium]|nr:signal transduction histidine kinase [Armatimonadota bacterium]
MRTWWPKRALHDERRPGLPEALRGRANWTIWKNPRYGNQDTMYANVPVLENGQIIGAVRVAYTLTQIQQKIAYIRGVLFTSVGVYAALIIVLTVWLAGSIAAPVEALTRDAQRLGRGDLSHRIHVKGTEEINQLAQTLNQMTEQLRHLEGMRRQYVSNVSHELRTPLASIRGMAETLLVHGESDPELRQRYLPRIVSQTDRLARLATQFLDLALIESGSVLKFLTSVSLPSVFAEVASTSGERAESEGVRLRIDVPDDLPPIVADRDRLVQVFINLVDNAIRYTPPGGEVAIRSRLDGDQICATVSDTGSGIPPEHL